MKRLTRLLLAMTMSLSAVCCLSGLIGCAHQDISIIPDSREIVDLSNGSDPRPGWYGISSGYLRQIFQDMDKCGAKQ